MFLTRKKKVKYTQQLKKIVFLAEAMGFFTGRETGDYREAGQLSAERRKKGQAFGSC